MKSFAIFFAFPDSLARALVKPPEALGRLPRNMPDPSAVLGRLAIDRS